MSGGGDKLKGPGESVVEVRSGKGVERERQRQRDRDRETESEDIMRCHDCYPYGMVRKVVTNETRVSVTVKDSKTGTYGNVL
jgi:hypothetical protein